TRASGSPADMAVVTLPETPITASGPPRARRLPIVPLAIITAFVLMAIFAGVLAPADPYEQSLRAKLKPPVWETGGSWSHPLGTARLGRDLLARVVYGARVSLAAGIVTVLLSGALGAAVGLVAGYHRGRVDVVLMRATDATLSFPIILLALILAVT